MPAVVDGILLVKNVREMAAFDLAIGSKNRGRVSSCGKTPVVVAPSFPQDEDPFRPPPTFLTTAIACSGVDEVPCSMPVTQFSAKHAEESLS